LKDNDTWQNSEQRSFRDTNFVGFIQRQSQNLEPLLAMSVPRVGDYTLGRTIGAGASSRVRLGVHSPTSHEYAIKIVNKSQFDSKPDLQRKIRREIAIMRILDHPHLMKFIDALESPGHLYIVLELASNGELFDYLVKHKRIDIATALTFFRGIIYGVDYLHARGICHRDLKPENILLDEFHRVKIADFGFANWMRHSWVLTSCGSPHYAAPEVISGKPYDGRAADVWSCGVILYALLAGRLPFDDPSLRIVLSKVRAGTYRMPELPPVLQDLISKILVRDVSARLTMAELKQHRAFTFDLPTLAYRLPNPVAIPATIEPIDPSSVDPSKIALLNSLGYESEAEIMKELTSSGNSSAKVFCRVADMREMGIEMFPWEIQEPVEKIKPQDMEEEEEEEDESTDVLKRPPLVDGMKTGEGETAVFKDVTMLMEAVMAAFQRLFDGALQWFHPTPTEIVAGSLADGFFMAVHGKSLTETTLEVSVQLVKGSAAIFDEWIRKMKPLLHVKRPADPGDEVADTIEADCL
jgi:BR serine/threonine kinase